MNNRILFLRIPEAGKSKIKVLSDSVPGESQLPGLDTVVFGKYSQTLTSGTGWTWLPSCHPPSSKKNFLTFIYF